MVFTRRLSQLHQAERYPAEDTLNQQQSTHQIMMTEIVENIEPSKLSTKPYRSFAEPARATEQRKPLQPTRFIRKPRPPSRAFSGPSFDFACFDPFFIQGSEVDHDIGYCASRTGGSEKDALEDDAMFCPETRQKPSSRRSNRQASYSLGPSSEPRARSPRTLQPAPSRGLPMRYRGPSKPGRKWGSLADLMADQISVKPRVPRFKSAHSKAPAATPRNVSSHAGGKNKRSARGNAEETWQQWWERGTAAVKARAGQNGPPTTKPHASVSTQTDLTCLWGASVPGCISLAAAAGPGEHDAAGRGASARGSVGSEACGGDEGGSWTPGDSGRGAGGASGGASSGGEDNDDARRRSRLISEITGEKGQEETNGSNQASEGERIPAGGNPSLEQQIKDPGPQKQDEEGPASGSQEKGVDNQAVEQSIALVADADEAACVVQAAAAGSGDKAGDNQGEDEVAPKEAAGLQEGNCSDTAKEGALLVPRPSLPCKRSHEGCEEEEHDVQVNAATKGGAGFSGLGEPLSAAVGDGFKGCPLEDHDNKVASAGSEQVLPSSSTKKRKTSRRRSHFFLRGDKEVANSPRRRSKWTPPQSPFGLIQEQVYDDPWKVMICCILLNKTSITQVRRVIWELFRLCPTPQAAIDADDSSIEALIQPLGIQHKRTHDIRQFSIDYLEKDWESPLELHGIGKYGADAYQIFCEGNWKEVQPQDKELNLYHNWLRETDGQGTGLERDPAPLP